MRLLTGPERLSRYRTHRVDHPPKGGRWGDTGSEEPELFRVAHGGDKRRAGDEGHSGRNDG